MTAASTTRTKKIRKDRAFSWTTARKFRFPSKHDRWIALTQHRRALQECAEAGVQPCLADDRFMPGVLFAALVWSVEHIALPMDRHCSYLLHGDSSGITELSLTLSEYGIDSARAERLEEALLALEPYPSKKPVEQHQIVKVLADCGGIWPDSERPAFERSARIQGDSLPDRRDIPA